MNRDQVIAKLKQLGWPSNSYVAYGGCPLAIAGIRPANDIDVLVSHELFSRLEQAGWQQLIKAPNDKPLTYDIFEAHENWDHSPYSPTLKHLQSSADIIDGIPFASLLEVRKWKEASGREKDLADIKLIDQYLREHSEIDRR